MQFQSSYTTEHAIVEMEEYEERKSETSESLNIRGRYQYRFQ